MQLSKAESTYLHVLPTSDLAKTTLLDYRCSIKCFIFLLQDRRMMREKSHRAESIIIKEEKFSNIRDTLEDIIMQKTSTDNQSENTRFS